MYNNFVPEILENGAEYYPPVDYDAYDEHELDMYYLGDNYGKEDE